MSGSFENIDVPPTLVSFAVTTSKVGRIVSPEFKSAGSSVILLTPETDESGLPEPKSLLALIARVEGMIDSGRVRACYTPGLGGIAEAVMKMCLGNGLGFEFAPDVTDEELFGYCYAGFLLEVEHAEGGERVVGKVTAERMISRGSDRIELSELHKAYEEKLEPVFPTRTDERRSAPETLSGALRKSCAPAVRTVRPTVLIPVFPGTNCEYDSAKAVEDAGANARIVVINNRTADGISFSSEAFSHAVDESQAIFIPGGFSGGDEPDGSGKFITAFFRGAEVRDAVTDLLDRRGGLMCGICNGFQALIKLGLVPYGKIIDTDESCPTLTYNTIARHQSRIVRTRIVSNSSPWLSLMNVGDVVNVPISHGEGRFIASDEFMQSLIENGQVATQYVDLDGYATYDIRYNPNGSLLAVEGITSPDGRVFGKMGHSERIGNGLYKNVPGCYDIRMFESAVRFFKG